MSKTLLNITKKLYTTAIAMEQNPRVINVKNLLGNGSPNIKNVNQLDQRVCEAAQQLNDGNVIALPTDTVYGLACSANNPDAIQKLYKIKGREETKPVAICVAGLRELRLWGEASHLPNELLQQLLPGAVTIVLYKSAKLDNPYLNPGVPKIGIRIPDHLFIQHVSTAFNYPIALTSANKSSEKSTLEVAEFKDLLPQLGAVFDGGHLGDFDHEQEQRLASTVVDLSQPGVYSIIRKGIALHQTVEVLKLFRIENV